MSKTELIRVKSILSADVSRHILKLGFSNGEIRTFDFTPYLEIKPFAKLRSTEVFKKAEVCCGTVMWREEEIDFAPETLYFKSTAA
jgi:hypothetical protein